MKKIQEKWIVIFIVGQNGARKQNEGENSALLPAQNTRILQPCQNCPCAS